MQKKSFWNVLFDEVAYEVAHALAAEVGRGLGEALAESIGNGKTQEVSIQNGIAKANS